MSDPREQGTSPPESKYLRHAARALAAAILVVGAISAHAQSGGAPFRIFPPTGVMEIGGNTNYPQVFTPLPAPNALGRFDGGWHRHTNPTTMDPPPSWDPSLVVLPSYGIDGGKQLNAFFGYAITRPDQRVAVPYWDTDVTGSQWFYHPATLVPPAHPVEGQAFSPQTGFAWQDDNRRRRLNVFGTIQRAQSETIPNGPLTNSLRELYWAGQWQWSDHGRPPGTDQMIVGRSAALWDATAGRGRVFVAAMPNTSQPPRVFMRIYDPATNWRWQDLDSPLDERPPGGGRDAAVRLGAPISVGRVENGTYKINLFVIGLVARERAGIASQFRFQLFERAWDGQRWNDWKSWGDVPGTYSGIDSQRIFSEGARLNSAVVWQSGALQRINLFGHTDLGKLLEFFWDGNTWAWGSLDGPPSGERIRSSSSVLDRSNGNQVIVYSRAASGAVWLRTYDLNRGGGWVWRTILQ